MSPIRHYVSGDQRNFRAFHEASRFMSTVPMVEDAVRRFHARGFAVLVVTARDARFDRPTRDFLARHAIPFHRLYMRGWGDQRRDTLVKADILAAIRVDGFTPVLAFDDRQDIARVWMGAGIPTILVASDDAPG
ncbi:MAG: hypothetical protein LC650_00745 [Actinobacteria bacterium]|nr:hypothetical protein [Actinomycetota bacterium]